MRKGKFLFYSSRFVALGFLTWLPVTVYILKLCRPSSFIIIYIDLRVLFGSQQTTWLSKQIMHYTLCLNCCSIKLVGKRNKPHQWVRESTTVKIYLDFSETSQ